MTAARTEARRRRLRRWVVRLGLVGLVLVAAEVGFRLWLAASGEPYDAAATAASLRRRLESSALLEHPGVDPPGRAAEAPAGGRLPHPYFGWHAQAWRTQIEQGLRERQAGDPAYRIWIVGGSVAGGFGQGRAGAGRLIELLRADPRFSERAVVVDSHARAAFKQPQQLMQVAYLFSLGLAPDAVINIDGFNEVAIGNMNALHGAHPIYPSITQWGAAVVPREALPRLEHNRRRVATLRGRARRAGRTVLDRGLYHSSLIGWWTERRLGHWAWKIRTLDTDSNHALLAIGSGDILRGPALASPAGSWEAIVTNWVQSNRSLAALCAVRGVYYVHVLQPTLHDEGSKPLSPEEVASARLDESWIEGARRGYPLLRAASAELSQAGVVFVDASNVFADVTGTLYYDGCHFDAEGNTLLAERIAPAFLEHLPR